MKTQEITPPGCTDIPQKNALRTIMYYCIPFLLFNLLGGLTLTFRLYHLFRTILVLYLTDFVLFPFLFIIIVVWKIVRRNIMISSPNKRFYREMLKSIRGYEIGIISVSLLLFFIFIYASLIEPHQLQIEEIKLVSEKVTKPVKILHISDIQSASVGRYEHQVFQRIKQLNPDIIFHTGDLLQPYRYKNLHQEQEKLAQLFQGLQPPYGIYNVIGNVDWRVQPQQFDRLAGITTLNDTHQVIIGEGVTFNILGLSLASSQGGSRALIEQWTQTSAKQEFSILLGHTPNYLVNILDLNIDLCLAGHTHGGQIRLPFVGPLITLSAVPREWAMGYRKLQNLHVNVSAGIGAEHASQLPSIRFNCPPTMTLFTIKNPN